MLLLFNLLNLSKGRRGQVKYNERKLLAACGRAGRGGDGGSGILKWKMGASVVPKKNIIKSNQSEDADADAVAATAHESKIN